MKRKRILGILLALTLSMAVTACGTTGSSGNGSNASSDGGSVSQSQNVTEVVTELSADASTYFADGDYKDVTSETPNATITLNGNTGTISDTTRGSDGDTVTITSKGIYHISGTSKDVSIVIDDSTQSGNIYLVLDNVTMENAAKPCIIVEAADKVILQCVGTNTLTYTANDEKYDGAIYAKDDLTINGSGTLSVSSSLHGIVCKKDLRITGADICVEADSVGIQSLKTIRMSNASVSIISGHDGMQIQGDAKENYLYLASGKVSIEAGYDGVDLSKESDDATVECLLAGGELSIVAGGGSQNSKDSKTSQKGIKCDGDIKIGDVDLTISTADDALHSGENVYITDGTLELSSSDDGVHADNILSISGGKMSVTKSYEGLEAYEILISGGATSVVASDDGINAAGGSDTNSTESAPARWGGMSESTGTLTISGGYLYVNAQGDGLDSNGSLYVTGGTVIVEGPTDGGNGALDKGDGNDCVAEITGGTVLAIGSTGMAVNFNSGSQCSGLVGLTGEAGTTITVEDGSGFSFTTTKAFQCIVYSSPSMSKGNSYDVKAGTESVTMDFGDSLYYSDVASADPGGMGGRQGNPGMGGR